jgi:hypothetical protein
MHSPTPIHRPRANAMPRLVAIPAHSQLKLRATLEILVPIRPLELEPANLFSISDLGFNRHIRPLCGTEASHGVR